MKQCTKCQNLTDNFALNKKTKDGLQSWCKDCHNKTKTNYNRTKNGLVTRIYSNQKANSKRRGHKPPNYNLKELKDWIFSQPNFEEIYTNWKKSNYKTDLVPSIDRIDDYKGYSLDNIQLTTWSENNKSGNNDRSKSVIQLDLQDNKITEFISQREASRQTGIKQINISRYCRGIKKTTGKFKWKFKH